MLVQSILNLVTSATSVIDVRQRTDRGAEEIVVHLPYIVINSDCDIKAKLLVCSKHLFLSLLQGQV